MNPPRIHTLRDSATPRTSDCYTPRTMQGNDGAFKTREYGTWIEGPYRGTSVWTQRFMWAGIVVTLVAAAAVMVMA